MILLQIHSPGVAFAPLERHAPGAIDVQTVNKSTTGISSVMCSVGPWHEPGIEASGKFT